jgi:hypothetical protein
VRFEARQDSANALSTEIQLHRVISNPLAPGDSLVFLQARGTAHIEAVIAGAGLEFSAPGFAEVFVPARQTAPPVP